MMMIRPEQMSDIDEITSIHNLAFDHHAEGQLVCKLREACLFSDRMSLVAVGDGNQYLGHVLFSDIELVHPAGNIKTAALAPVAVIPEFQNRGIGSRLIKTGLENLESLEYEAVLVLGEPKYYARFGFSHEEAQNISCTYQCPAFMALGLGNVNLSKYQSLNAVYSTPFQIFS